MSKGLELGGHILAPVAGRPGKQAGAGSSKPWVSEGQPTGDAFCPVSFLPIVLPQALGKASGRQGSGCGSGSLGPVSLRDTPGTHGSPW